MECYTHIRGFRRHSITDTCGVPVAGSAMVYAAANLSVSKEVQSQHTRTLTTCPSSVSLARNTQVLTCTGSISFTDSAGVNIEAEAEFKEREGEQGQRLG